jgi:hypothetical protein
LAAHFVPKLRAACEFELNSAPRPAEANIEWGPSLYNFGDLSQVFELAISASNCRTTIATNDYDRLTALEFNRPATRRTLRLEHAHLALLRADRGRAMLN